MMRCIKQYFFYGFTGLFTVGTLVGLNFLYHATLKGQAVSLFATDEKRIVSSYKDLATLYPSSPEEIKSVVAASIERAKKGLEAIIAISEEEKTYENTVFAQSELFVPLSELMSILGSLAYVHPHEALRKAADEQKLLIGDFFTDHVALNREFYLALASYAEKRASSEKLTEEQKYYLHEELESFKRSGVDKSDDVREKIKEVSKKLQKVTSDFGAAIAKDNKHITAMAQELAGVSEKFVATLKKNDKGELIIPCDYPSRAEIMTHCSNPQLRKRFANAFLTRAYPQNRENLLTMIALRDELAQLLGYKNFSEANLDGTMAKTVETVEHFWKKIEKKARAKYEKEVKNLLSDVPEGLSGTDKLYPWDTGYLMEYHRQKYYNVDDRKVAEYFPMESTIKGLFDIYQQFLGLTFIEHKPENPWHPDVRLLEVKTAQDNVTRGYVFLDLYPRPFKYTHACHYGTIRAQKMVDEQGSVTIKPSVALIICNFPKGTEDCPSLLKYKDATTFFHEFGHALHNLLGATLHSDTSGTAVKLDFVEMPSQMFEEWLNDKEMLRRVTHHYQTGEPMPDDMIDRLISLAHFDAGMRISGQMQLGEIALRLFMGKSNDPEALDKEVFKRYAPSNVYYNEEQKFYASFGHLGGYASRYYCYLWSEVFALDLFENIKKHGLLNTEYGQKFGEAVLGKGGSQDPEEILERFLGRKPKPDAFMRSYGLEE